MTAACDDATKYGPSPLARHSNAVRTASALMLLDVAPAAIVFELRRQHGLTDEQATAVMREAAADVPRPLRPPARRAR